MEQETQIQNEKIQLIQTVISNALQVIDQPREREIINRRFGLGEKKETLEQIGERLDITRERVRQLEKAALIRLKIAAEKGSIEHLAEIEKTIIRNLAEVGRISKTKNLVEKTIESESSDQQIFNFLFIAEISSKLVLVQENDKYNSAIANAEYGDERKTKVINHELGKFSDEELIPEEESVILLTSENYIKRTLLADYRRQNRGGKGKRGMTTKDQDIIDQLIPASTHDWLLFFTNRGRVFRLKAYEVPAASLQAKGVAAVNLLQLQPEEKITSIIKLEQNSSDKDFLFMATVKGTVKKTALKDFANIRTNGLNAINLDEGDELRWIQKTDGESDIIISTSAGQAVRFNEDDVRAMGRAARGVRGVRLRPNDNVVGMDIVTDADQKLLVISANGYGKSTKVANFEVKRRGGIGVKAAIVTSKTGPIVSVQTLPKESTDALMISTGGPTIRVAIKDIPTLSRTTQGVRIMKLSNNDLVASVGLMEESQEE